MSHTRGPWFADLYEGVWALCPEGSHRHYEYKIASVVGGKIFDVDGREFKGSEGAKQTRCNCHLIAASPDLLIACELALPLIDDYEVAKIISDAICKAKSGGE
jgi:hypothetical protein